MGIVAALGMVGKALMEAVQGGSGLTRAIVPSLMGLISAALLFNIITVIRFIGDVANGMLSAIGNLVGII